MRMLLVHGFLLGVIATASIAAGGFFLKFWRQSHDGLFLAFGVAFIIEGINRIFLIFVEQPDEGHPAVYVVRLLAFLIILAAIVRSELLGHDPRPDHRRG